MGAEIFVNNEGVITVPWNHRLYRGWKNPYFRFFKIEAGDVVLDLGASRGDFAAMCLNVPKTKCISVEASNFNSIILKKRTDLWNETLKEQRFVTAPRAITGADTGSFVEIDTNITDGRRWKTLTCIAIDERTSSSDEARRSDSNFVETISFMDLIRQHNLNHIDFMKMDVEGSEYSIFNDEESFDFILNNIDKIVIEFHLQYLREVQGYSEEEAVETSNKIIDRFIEAGHELHVLPRTRFVKMTREPRPTLNTDCMDLWAIRK